MTKAELYQKACMLPLLPGVYIIRDKSDTIIYIGKAKRLRIRVSQYFREGVPHDNKVSQMLFLEPIRDASSSSSSLPLPETCKLCRMERKSHVFGAEDPVPGYIHHAVAHRRSDENSD